MGICYKCWSFEVDVHLNVKPITPPPPPFPFTPKGLMNLIELGKNMFRYCQPFLAFCLTSFCVCSLSPYLKLNILMVCIL